MTQTAVAPGRRPEPTRGRKRDTELTDAILLVAGELLMETGYDHLRIQDVASRAGCGTGAIYRRWATKEDLVADTIRCMDFAGVEPTDDPRADLRALVVEKACLSSDQPDLLPGMIAAMRAHPVIADAVNERYTTEPFRVVLARILGPDHPQLDVLAELAPALNLNRSAFRAGSVDPETLADDVLAIVDAVADNAN